MLAWDSFKSIPFSFLRVSVQLYCGTKESDINVRENEVPDLESYNLCKFYVSYV